MIITKVSEISGKTHTMDIPVTEQQLENFKNGMLIQRAMPNLTTSEREFILTGSTDEEWEDLFKLMRDE
jgi:hypothetical protein